jgi:pimeloyl-ACP methyl ester carboxylesterase
MEPILALHSSLSSKAQWRPLADYLGTYYSVAAVDLHGYGASRLTAASISLEEEAARALMRARDLIGSRQPVHLIGHSYGGAVALTLAKMWPERVRSLTVYEPVLFNVLPPNGTQATLARWMAGRVEWHVRRSELDHAARAFLEYWSGPGAYDRAPADRRERFEAGMRKVPLDYGAISTGPCEAAAYAAIGVPTLIMSGKRSVPAAREIARRLAAAMPTARLDEMPGDHLMPINDPDAFNPAVARFLANLNEPANARTGTRG